jgi:peptide chain release factor 1
MQYIHVTPRFIVLGAWRRQNLARTSYLRTGSIRSILSDVMRKRVDAVVTKHASILERLAEGESSSIAKDLSTLSRVTNLHQKLSTIENDVRSMEELLEAAAFAEDMDMEEECKTELEKLKASQAVLEDRIVEALLPKDEDDSCDALLEIRAGTGGDEASLFAAELLESYINTAQGKRWKVEILHKSENDIGGVKEASISISGEPNKYFDDDAAEGNNSLAGLGPCGFFKFESGVHRVQRIPINALKIHTSACSVGVLPSPSEEQSNQLLPMSELKIETMRSSGPGGQSVNTTDSAVRVTHIPTGITACIQDERSQHKNRAKALKIIAARVMELHREQLQKERGQARNKLMGSGDRSERIRTYNYPQDRITDHRCKVSEHGIERLMGGTIEGGLVTTFAPVLRAMSRDELVKELETDL